MSVERKVGMTQMACMMADTTVSKKARKRVEKRVDWMAG